MDACLAVLVHSAEMRHDNTTELSILYRHAGRVHDFDQNVIMTQELLASALGVRRF